MTSPHSDRTWPGASWRVPLRHRLVLKDAWASAGPEQRSSCGILSWPTEEAHGVAERALEAAKSPGSTLILHGPRGTGKTQLAAWIAWSLYRLFCDAEEPARCSTGAYYTLPELLDLERGSWRQEGVPSPLRRARSSDLLVLDEIQERSRESEWEERELVALIDYRYREMGRTLLVTNLDAEGLKKLPTSMWSRLVETGVAVPCTWPSFRGPK